MNQISLFDLFDMSENQIEVNKPSVLNKEINKEQMIHSSLDEVMKDRYTNCKRLIRLASSRYCVEYYDKAIYLTSKGEVDYETTNAVSIIALDSIVYAASDVLTNDTQEEVLNSIIKNDSNKIKLLIKRFGDPNYIFRDNNDVWHSITSKGWILDYRSSNIEYKDEEVVLIPTHEIEENVDILEVSENVSILEEKENIIITEEVKVNNSLVIYNAGDKVEVTFKGKCYTGEVHSVYNEGKTVNVVFEKKHTAFFVGSIRKAS